jgi:hypothetical protein
MPQLSADTREALGQTVPQFIEVNQGPRAQYDRSLDVANTKYEMRTQPCNVLWPNAENIVLPMVATGVDELVSRVTGAVYQPRLFTVRGSDPLSKHGGIVQTSSFGDRVSVLEVGSASDLTLY